MSESPACIVGIVNLWDGVTRIDRGIDADVAPTEPSRHLPVHTGQGSVLRRQTVTRSIAPRGAGADVVAALSRVAQVVADARPPDLIHQAVVVDRGGHRKGGSGNRG